MKTIVLALALTLASIAHADIKQISDEYAKCSASEDADTKEQKDCSYTAYHAADKELNRIYNLIKTPLQKSRNPDDKEILSRLVKSERAWVTYRETDCSFQGTSALRASNELVVIGSCLASKTIERVNILIEFLP